MSLKVWLPLNGNLNNKGSSKLTFTNENFTNIAINNNGKIGQCYTRASAKTAGRIISNSTLLLDGDLSMCCWAKVTATVGDTANGLVSMHSHANNTGFGITVKLASSTDYRISCSTGNGSNRTYCTYYGTTNIKDAWHHLALTYNSTTKIFLLWVDGVVEYSLSYTNSSRAEQVMLFEWSTTHNAVDYRPACSLNDVRIYDHCLSPEEINELAKGLVLHYKLNDIYIESLTNLTNALSNSCYNGAISKYNYGTITDMYKTSGVFQGKQCEKVYMGTNGQAAYPYVFFDNLHPSNNSYKTLSFDYYPTIQNQIIFYTYGGSGTTYYRVNNGPQTSGSSIPVNLNSWNHIEFTILGTSDSSSGWGYMRIGTGNHTSNTSNYWLFANILVEARDHATGYNSSFHKSIITDSSGYGNNGISSGDIIISTDIARYNISTKLNDSASAIAIGNLSTIVPEGIFTFNIWFKKITGEWSSKGYETILGGPSGFELEMKKSGTNSPVLWLYSWGLTEIAYTLDEWHMLTMVRTTSDSKYYLDGLQVLTGSAGSIPSGNYFIGAWRDNVSLNYRGLLSDARIYSVALTAQQILDLYKNEVSIDNKENIYARELVEE